MTNVMTDRQKIRVVLMILEALEDAVRLAGDRGAPGSVLYAAMMTQVPNMTAAQFEELMGMLSRVGKVVKRGQLYFAANGVCERCGIVKTSGHTCGSCGEDV
jgi:hypothetical protein